MRKSTKSRKNFLIFFLGCMTLLLLNIGCTSQFKESEKNSKPLPVFPYVVGAKSYFYAANIPMISLLAKAYGVGNQLLIKNISNIALTFTDNATVIFVRLTPNAKLSEFSKRVRLMKRIKAKSLDEDGLFWRIEHADKTYLVNIAYTDALLMIDVADIQMLKRLEFLTELPKALRILAVNNTYALWLWASMDMFDDTFASQKIRGDHGAVAIPQYNVGEDVSVDFALPYDGKRSDLATLKLMLPFLFKSFGANILASLPDISFAKNMVVIRGVNLSIKTIQSLALTVTNNKEK